MAHDVFKIIVDSDNNHHQIIAVNGRDLVPLYDRADSSFEIEFSDADSEATDIMVANGN